MVLGFVEIALAFKFLSIADQAFHWGILDREINIAIWIVIVVLIGIYLMKGFRMPGDTGKDAEDKTSKRSTNFTCYDCLCVCCLS
ncbi:MAG: hypothetical protein U5K54_16920 [Cytophagales bacterium]|nr:hypothetical protein [Cytophagales bacterium]